MSIQEDVQLAQEIASMKKHQSILFTNGSSIYKTTNENIKHPNYLKHIRDKESILSVIGSGDQIINCILFGTTKIDAFDISRFPKYYLELKLAAIEYLSYEEYLEFFYGKNSFDRNNYKRIVDSMNTPYKDFWENVATTKLFSNGPKPREIYDSPLFTGEGSLDTALRVNPYLTKENYELAKKRIREISITYHTGDIIKLAPTLKGKHDFVNLSNIGSYHNDFLIEYPKEMKVECEWKKLMKSFPLNPNGEVLSYLMAYVKNGTAYRYVEKYYQEDKDFMVEGIEENEDSIPDAILVYQKKK